MGKPGPKVRRSNRGLKKLSAMDRLRIGIKYNEMARAIATKDATQKIISGSKYARVIQDSLDRICEDRGNGIDKSTAIAAHQKRLRLAGEHHRRFYEKKGVFPKNQIIQLISRELTSKGFKASEITISRICKDYEDFVLRSRASDSLK